MARYGFDGVVLRHNRAGEHLAKIDAMVAWFLKGNPYVIPANHPDFEGPDLDRASLTRSDFPNVPLNPMLGVLVGETIYNLRTALEYLIFSLSWHDSGIRPVDPWAKALHFPALNEEPKEGFKTWSATALKGLSMKHVAIVEECQPYNGGEWLKTLVALSNPDKHRHLIHVVASALYERGGEYRLDLVWSDASAPGRHFPDDVVDMNLYATLDITFQEGMLVSETLQELHSQVGNLIARIEPDVRLHPLT